MADRVLFPLSRSSIASDVVAFVVARREEREAVQSTVLLSGGDVETILSIKGMRKSVMRRHANPSILLLFI